MFKLRPYSPSISGFQAIEFVLSSRLPVSHVYWKKMLQGNMVMPCFIIEVKVKIPIKTLRRIGIKLLTELDSQKLF